MFAKYEKFARHLQYCIRNGGLNITYDLDFHAFQRQFFLVKYIFWPKYVYFHIPKVPYSQCVRSFYPITLFKAFLLYLYLFTRRKLFKKLQKMHFILPKKFFLFSKYSTFSLSSSLLFSPAANCWVTAQSIETHGKET